MGFGSVMTIRRNVSGELSNGIHLRLVKRLAQVRMQKSNATSGRSRNVLKAHQDTHHVEATRSIETRIYHRILYLGRYVATSSHHNILRTRTPRIENRVPSGSLRIGE